MGALARKGAGMIISTSFRVISEGRTIAVKGRVTWALRCLMKAGKRGCTSIDHPGPRWASYTHKLRSLHGLVIETVKERHDGEFPGWHARYVLHSEVEEVENGAAHASNTPTLHLPRCGLVPSSADERRPS